ncbi:MAG TPA: hypothetical protein VII33_12800 [Nakamurella sp.]
MAANITTKPARLMVTPAAKLRLRHDLTRHQRNHPEKERETANDRPVTAEMIEADRGHERRVVVAQSALDLVKRALLVVGQRHDGTLLRPRPVPLDRDRPSRNS